MYKDSAYLTGIHSAIEFSVNRIFLSVLLLVAIGSSVAHAQIAGEATTEEASLRDLTRDLSDIFSDTTFSNATWGVAIQSMETGEYLYRSNENKSLLPASNFKLFTAAEALSLLSPEFRYTTHLLTLGKISDGVLKGDLIIRGAGDPTFGSTSMYPDSSPSWIFNMWADSLKKLGVTKVEGSVVGDDTYFTDDLYPLGWAIEDEPYYYAMQTSALVFNENSVTVSVSPGLSKGSSVTYELNPNTDYLDVDNRGITKADSITGKNRHGKDTAIAPGSTTIDITHDLGSNTVTIRGQMPLSGEVTHEELSVENPTLFAATTFQEALEEKGITVTGKIRNARDQKPIPYLKTKVLASYVSPPLSEIVAVMNKESDNLYAEQLFRTMAKELGGEGSWKVGIEVMKKYLASIGLDTAHLAIYDGSGLSRMDLISANQMVGLLRSMYSRQSLFSVFYPSLSIMGVDGTLAHRLRDTRAQGNVHAKTGFVTEVRSISGYVTTRDGELLAFSIIGNGLTGPVSQANNLHDLVMLRLANFSRK